MELVAATVTGSHVDSKPARSETCPVPAVMTQDYHNPVSPGKHQNNTLNNPQYLLRMEQHPPPSGQDIRRDLYINQQDAQNSYD